MFMDQNRFYHLLSRHLSNETTSVENEELNFTLKNNPHLIFIKDKLENYWRSEPNKDVDFLNATYIQHKEKINQLLPVKSSNFFKKWTPFFNFNKKYFLSLMAACFFIVIFLFSYNYYKQQHHSISTKNKPNEYKTYQVPLGQKGYIKLQDGTEVWLNAGSEIIYPNKFAKNSRTIKLQGEAFFKVAHNSNRPFYIESPNLKVKVLGTEFNVKNYRFEKTAEATLIKGKIEITLDQNTSSKTIVLEPMEKLVIRHDSSHIISIKNNNSKNFKPSLKTLDPFLEIKKIDQEQQALVETEWVDNIIRFDEENFFDVSQKLSRWYNVEFVFNNENAKNIMMSGIFKNKAIDQVMEILQYSFHINYQIQNNKIIIN